MTEVKDNSSLPLLLGISGTVFLVAVGGWYLLEQESPASAVPGDNPVAASLSSSITASLPSPKPARKADTASPAESVSRESAADESARPATATATSEIDAELIKARLAAEADILIFPAEHSALRYYAKVLKADPRHAVAKAELDTVLTRVATTVSAHLAAEEYKSAYDIAALVASYDPEHALVVETQQTLDNRTEQLVQQAIELAQAGNDKEAADVLATARALPGRNPEYFIAVRDSIAEIRAVREAAEQDRLRRSQLANEQARTAWVDGIRAAIAQGNLLAPAGASAKDLLAERNSWDDDRERMSAEFYTALVGATAADISANRLPSAEKLLDAAVQLNGKSPELDQLQTRLDNAFVAMESSRVVGLDELVRLRTAPAQYPRRAEERGLSGWVDVEFTVTPTGETADISVTAAEPEDIFDRSAINAVEQWTFEPTEYRGRVISKRAAARLVFRLE